jgi:hypothetical protein
MTPLLVRALAQNNARACLHEIWNQLTEETRAMAIENLSATAALLVLFEDLEEAGIAALAVKGPVAGLTLYGDVALRPFLDLDVLIAPDDRDRAIECLVARGYQQSVNLDAVGWRRYFQRYIEMSWMHPHTGGAIDLHWALLDSRYRYSAVLDGCHERAVPLSIGARQIRTLCPEDTLVYSLMHAAKHQWRVLRSLVDAALLIETRDDIDWGTIALAVEKAPSCRRVIAVGLHLVELLFGVPVNVVVAHWIAGDARAEELAVEAFRFLTIPDVPAPPGLPWLWRQPFHRSLCPQDRLRHIYHTLLPPALGDWMAVPLPEWLGWLYPAVRVARLTEKYVWQSLWRSVKPQRALRRGSGRRTPV